ncbi:hypothetical protein EXIGLDRAFT_706751 [Exidia glandulosa HHB12029]|uniref:Uncharacterized protein n=1 Tax=Exidia glandulosa HHB12029 TaxID=1314781 RepID=A0A165B0M3_EXIGL|nr:hypothetical protein EXIGLDRAFT_706751 [Exidia glandulosa HHB12029]
MAASLDLPSHIPNIAWCQSCDKAHKPSISAAGQLVFKASYERHYPTAQVLTLRVIVAKFNAQRKRWVVVDEFVNTIAVQQLERQNVPRARPFFPGGYRRNTLVGLVQPDAGPAPNIPLGDRAGTVQLRLESAEQATYTTPFTISSHYFGLEDLSVPQQQALHLHEVVTRFLEIRIRDVWRLCTRDTRYEIGGTTRLIELRAPSNVFPFRFARDMASSFTRYKALMTGDPQTPIAHAFNAGFGAIPFVTVADAFLEADNVWSTISAEAQAKFLRAPRDADHLWTAVVAAAAEIKRTAAQHDVQRDHAPALKRRIKVEPGVDGGEPVRKKPRHSGERVLEVLDDGTVQAKIDYIDLTIDD